MSEQIRPCGMYWAYCDGNCDKCNLSQRTYDTNISDCCPIFSNKTESEQNAAD